jgi:uncharacterized protein YdcH (DUF465 family)
MTKSEEIALLSGFTAKLGDGYLKDIFSDVQPMIERAITSDFCVIGFGDLQDAKSELNREIKELGIKKSALAKEVVELEQDKLQLQEALAKIKRTASSIAAYR